MAIEDAPTLKERPVMRKIVEYAQEELRSNDINLTIADFQAILWFFEKDLHVAYHATSTTGATRLIGARRLAGDDREFNC